MPIWVAAELWDFGMLSRLYEGLQKRDRDAIAARFAPLEGHVLVNWLRMLNFVRNTSAHHSRLWNRTLPDPVRLPPLSDCPELLALHADPLARRKLFAAFTCLRVLLKGIDPKSDWHKRALAHLWTFPSSDLCSLASAGFASG